MRCTSCNKFAQFDTDTDPEVNDLQVSIDNQGEPEDREGQKVIPFQLQVTGYVRMVNNCADCGQEMAEANLDLDDLVEFLVPAEHVPMDGKGQPKELNEDAFEIDEDGTEREDYFQTKDRHGKPITKARFQKHIYKAVVSYVITGPGVVTLHGKVEAECQGGDFEDIQ